MLRVSRGQKTKPTDTQCKQMLEMTFLCIDLVYLLNGNQENSQYLIFKVVKFMPYNFLKKCTVSGTDQQIGSQYLGNKDNSTTSIFGDTLRGTTLKDSVKA